MSTFEQQLRKVCKHCKPSSLKTYHANVKALARIAKLDSVPTNKRWLSSALLKQVAAMPLQKYKRFSMAGVKALQAYGAKDQTWEAAMRDSTEKYSALRDSGRRRSAKGRPPPRAGRDCFRDGRSAAHCKGVGRRSWRPRTSSGPEGGASGQRCGFQQRGRSTGAFLSPKRLCCCG